MADKHLIAVVNENARAYSAAVIADAKASIVRAQSSRFYSACMRRNRNKRRVPRTGKVSIR